MIFRKKSRNNPPFKFAVIFFENVPKIFAGHAKNVIFTQQTERCMILVLLGRINYWGCTKMLETINGIQINIVEEGKGPAVILVHGLTADYHSMLPIMAWLSPDHRVIAYDCRGHGMSDKPAEYTLLDHGRDLLAIMDHYGLEQADVLGVSMGTYVTMQAAVLKPERFHRIVLIAPKGHGRTSSVQEIIKRAGKDMSEISQEEMIAMISDATFAPTTSSEQRRSIFAAQDGGVSLTPAETAAVNKALANFDLRPDLGKITCPTLVCSGKYDGINPPTLGREVADLISNSRFELFENSGHTLYLEEEDKCKAMVRNFLS